MNGPDRSRSLELLTATAVALAWPVQTWAASEAPAGWWGEAQATTILGVVAAVAWHHVSRRREGIAIRWKQMHLGDRLPHLRLGERLHGLQLRSALLAALRLRPESRHVAAAGHVRRVLIIDDDADLRMAIGEALTSQGFAVDEAADGYEGLVRARDERPDVILLDLKMPRLDGFGFRAAQRDDPELAGIPVVVVSGADTDPSRDVGASAYLHKPFDLRVLLEAVDRYAVAAAA